VGCGKMGKIRRKERRAATAGLLHILTGNERKRYRSVISGGGYIMMIGSAILIDERWW
jgi:hypothetical protein